MGVVLCRLFKGTLCGSLTKQDTPLRPPPPTTTPVQTPLLVVVIYVLFCFIGR